MKSLLTVVAALLAFAAGATEIELVEGSVAEVPSIGLAGVAYKVSYDDGTHLVTFKAKGETTASNCALIFHAVSIQDDAGKSVNGYNGNCGHTPGPTDVLMTDDGTGWLTFSLDANDYTPSLGMFLTVVLRQDNARNLERFFGLCSMTAPNDWASFDGSWDNRIKIAVPTPRVQINMIYPSPYLPGSADPAAPSSMGQNFVLSYTILPAGFTADAAMFSVKDKDGIVVFVDTTIARSGGPNMARWQVSTDSLRAINSTKGPYEVAVVISKGSYAYRDSRSLEVVPSTVTLESERSPAAGGQLRECMEGRRVTFKATAKGFVSEGTTHRNQFNFYYQDAAGRWSIANKWCLNLTNYFTMREEPVPSDNANHYYSAGVKAEVLDTYTHSAVSDVLAITVYKQWIDNFENVGVSPEPMSWKVVVGANIYFRANASRDCGTWAWEMPEGGAFSRRWNPTGGNSKQGSTMFIPYSDLPSKNNDDFGPSNGKVRVSCKDETGRTYTLDSTDMSPTRRASVFFPRDINVDGAIPTAAKPPCWFVFWASNKGGPCKWMYNRTSRHAGGRITWAFDPILVGAITRVNSERTEFTITLGGAGQVLDVSQTFVSPRYPAAPGSTFMNSAGVLTSFPSGTITMNFTRQTWEAIDSAEFVVRHEIRHVEHYRNWVRGGVWRGKRNTDSGVELLPDSYEDGFGTRWNDATTYLLTVPAFTLSDGYDDEIDCEVSAGNPCMADSSDWASPGKQWQ